MESQNNEKHEVPTDGLPQNLKPSGVNKRLPIAAVCCDFAGTSVVIPAVMFIDVGAWVFFPLSLAIFSLITGMVLGIVSLCRGKELIGKQGKDYAEQQIRPKT